MADWKEMLSHADVDVQGAIDRFSGKEDRYIKYLKLFYQDDNFELLVDAIDNKDIKAAFDYSHTLKGLAGNLGFNKMFKNVYDACEILRSGSDEGVKELIDGVTDNYHTIISIIEDNLID